MVDLDYMYCYNNNTMRRLMQQEFGDIKSQVIHLTLI